MLKKTILMIKNKILILKYNEYSNKFFFFQFICLFASTKWHLLSPAVKSHSSTKIFWSFETDSHRIPILALLTTLMSLKHWFMRIRGRKFCSGNACKTVKQSNDLKNIVLSLYIHEFELIAIDITDHSETKIEIWNEIDSGLYERIFPLISKKEKTNFFFHSTRSKQECEIHESFHGVSPSTDFINRIK